MIAFIRHLQGSVGIIGVLFGNSWPLNTSVDISFEWLEFLVEVQTENNRQSTTKKRKKKPTEKPKEKPKKPKATANFKFGTDFSGFFWAAKKPNSQDETFRRCKNHQSRFEG